MTDAVDVLELRIHGVNNTAPPNMLELPEAAIVQYEGDSLGNFWRPLPAAQALLSTSDPGRVPSGVMREAYSWGGMARNSIGGSSRIGKLVAGAARLGWTLLLPFSLLNMAYWSRRLMKPGRSPHTAWHNAGGAGLIRLAALSLTLLMATTISVLSLDVVGVQCYTGPTCAKFPSSVAFLANWQPSQRLALMSLVPVAVVTLLYVLTTASSVRYTQTSTAARAWTRDAGDAAEAASAAPQWPLLSTKGFWTPIRILVQTSRLHFAAVAALVSVLTAWQIVFGTGPNCEDASDLRSSACRAQVEATGARWIAGAVVIGLSSVLLALIAVQVMRVSEDSADIQAAKTRSSRPGTTVLVAAATVTFLFQLGVLALWRDASPVATAGMSARVLGMSELPAILVALTIGVALATLTCRYVMGKRRHIVQVAAVGVSVLLLFSATSTWHHHLTLVLDGGAVLLVACIGAVVVWGPMKAERRYEAWRGCAPGVFIVLALVSAMVLSSAVVVAVANLLNGNNSAASIADTRARQCTTTAAACLHVPRLYAWFGAMLLPMITLILALFALVLYRTRKAAVQIPQGPPGSGTMFSGPSDYPPIEHQVGHARWFASLTHRAECYAGALAALGGAALFAAVAVTVSGWAPKPHSRPTALVEWALGTGIWGLATLGATVIALVLGGPATASTRPLGLVWDLVCFLPKTAHPFGPPCYAERVVPELLGRYESWLTGDVPPKVDVDDKHSRPTPHQENRRIVLSAHSLGSVLAVATIFAMLDPEDAEATQHELRPISLLTYGSQLRAYFGRILPELLGPEVLGTKPCHAAQLLTVDPWSRERTNDTQTQIDSNALRALLKPHSQSRWINLWRRTDFIGFPVVEYAIEPSRSDDVDRRAEEVDETGYVLKVLTHSDYPRVPAYFKAFDDLRSRGLPPPRRRWIAGGR
jgi:hypothetical protein